MAAYKCLFFRTESGDSPVEDFIESLDYKTKRKFLFKRVLLEEYGPRLFYPHTKYLGDDIFELRFEGIEGTIRILYFFFYNNQIIFTNGFIKKSNKTPVQEKEAALQRRKTYFEREGT